MIVDALIEGPSDEAVARKLIEFCGHAFRAVYGKRGQGYLKQKAAGFNVRAAYGNPILMLVDYKDTRLKCPPEVPATWLPNRSAKLLLRVVVRELESWLMADADGLSQFLGISRTHIPRDPETVPDPKQAFVNLARRCRRSRLRDTIVPHQGISSVVGPGYIAAVDAFVARYWNVESACEVSPSLRRCTARLRELL